MYGRKGASYGRHRRTATSVDAAELLWDQALASPQTCKPVGAGIWSDADRSDVRSSSPQRENVLRPTTLNLTLCRPKPKQKREKKRRPVVEVVEDDLASRLGLLSVDEPSTDKALELAAELQPKVVPEVLPEVELDALLHFLDQSAPRDFEEYATSLDGVSKLGEASYAEVYRRHDAVYKVMPFGSEGELSVRDVVQELRCLRATTGIDGFNGMERAAVVKGEYAECLMRAWDEYAERKGTENERPYSTPDSLFIVLELRHGGVDIEHWEMPSWRAAQSCLRKIVAALAEAERRIEFEHRDLHWGNVLVDDEGRINIIDFTLSRCTPGDGLGRVAHNALADQALFEADGEVDYQFDIYRQMRDERQSDDWATYSPVTNVQWVHYLADKLLYAKGLPRPRRRRRGRRASTGGHDGEDDGAAYEWLLRVYRLIGPRDGARDVQSCTDLLAQL